MTTPTQPRFREPLPGEPVHLWYCWAKGQQPLSPSPVCPNSGRLVDTQTGNTVCGRCATRILAQQAKPSLWRRIFKRSK